MKAYDSTYSILCDNLYCKNTTLDNWCNIITAYDKTPCGNRKVRPVLWKSIFQVTPEEEPKLLKVILKICDKAIYKTYILIGVSERCTNT